MLRVTPLYGSTWNESGSAEVPSCTIVDFGGCQILVNFGWYGYHNTTTTSNNNNNNNNNDSIIKSIMIDGEIPYHDCLVLTDSTIQSIGGLPMYYKQMKYQISQQQQKQKHKKQDHNMSSSQRRLSNQKQELNESNNEPMIIDSDDHDNTIKDDHDNHNNYNKKRMMITMPPIYATFPTVKMGQMTLYDQHACICLDGGTPPYTLDDIDQVCHIMESIKYSQSIYLPAINISNHNTTNINDINKEIMSIHDRIRNATLTITAHRSGHVVGGAFYVIQRIQDETIVVVTDSTYHIAKEKHLDSSTLLQYGTTPDVLITKPGGPALYLLKSLYHPQQKKQKQKQKQKMIQQQSNSTTSQQQEQTSATSKSDEKQQSNYIPIPSILVSNAERTLIELVMSVLRRDGNVLLPVDTSGRVLELLLLLNHYWETQRLSTSYNLIWCSYMCENTIQFAKSQLEWMSTSLESQQNNDSSIPGGGSKTPFDQSKKGNNNNNMGIGGGIHPLNLRCVRLCTSARQYDALVEELGGSTIKTSTTTGEVNNYNPTCVLASGLSLEGGPARDIFLKYADNPDNAIIFTDSSQCYLRQYQNNHNNQDNNNNNLENNNKTLSDNNDHNNNITPSLDKSSSNTNIKESLSDSKDSIAPLIRSNSTSFGIGVLPATTITSSTTLDEVIAAVDEEEGTDDNMNHNAIVTTTTIIEPSIWTTSGQLLKAWAKAKSNNTEMDDSIFIDVRVPYRVPLSGNELKTFLATEEERRFRRIADEERRAMLHEVELAKGQLRLGSNDDTDINIMTSSNTTTASAAVTSTSVASDPSKQESKVNTTTGVRPKKKSRFDSTLFVKFSKPLHLTFEIREEPAGIGQPEYVPRFGIGESYGRPGEILEDDYGIAVQPERFTDIVSGVDPSKFAGGTGRIGDDMKRGFGYGVTDNAANSSGGGKKKKSNNKSIKMVSGSSRVVSEDEDQDDVDTEYDEQELEALDLSEGTGIIRGRNGRQPIKVSSVYRQVEVLAEISYVPGLEGRVDARAARQSVRALQPREVIVLGGTKQQQHHDDDDYQDENISKKEEGSNDEIPTLIDEVTLLAEAAKSFATGSKSVLTPSDGETAELEIGHAAYSVRLIDTPYVSSIEKEREGYEPSQPIELYETKVGSCSASLLDYVANGQKVAIDGSIVLAPRKHIMPEHWISSDIDHIHPPVYVSDGEVLLTDLRSELIAQGMKAEYSSHSGYSQLLVNGKIVVRKDAQQQHNDNNANNDESNNTGNDIGNISIEGPLCEDFYLVRSIVGGQFVVLS